MTEPEVKINGLNDNEVLESRSKYGENILTPPKRKSMWRLYLEKFNDPVIRILLFAALLSLAVSIVENEYAETIGIIAAVLLATGVGFLFEYDANRKFDLLNAVNDDNNVRVRRNGNVCEVKRREVVVGDIVLVETGDEIPADGKLLDSLSMQVNESSLTGEPSANKTASEADFDKNATYKSNRLMRGSTVLDGHGTMVVEAVGDATEIGKVARLSSEETHEQTPLNKQLEKLARLIGYVGFATAGIAFVLFFVKDVVLAYDFGQMHTFADWLPAIKATLQIFMMAVTLIVVAVPEGLPMSVTLCLALNMRRMLATNNLVRKMHACETMGAITVICTDKTGTLTQNRMRISTPNFSGINNEDGNLQSSETGKLIAEAISVNTTSFLGKSDDGKTEGIGNPTEVALLLWLNDKNTDYLGIRGSIKVIDQLPFSTERKFMATMVESAVKGKKVLYIKGAPEIILGKCSKMQTADGVEAAPDNFKKDTEAFLLENQNKGMRTLGFAYAVIDDDSSVKCADAIANADFVFQGVVAISDPVRPEVPAAVAQCTKAGIEVKIVTGDTPATASEIARQIGLKVDKDSDIISGPEFAALDDAEAQKRAMEIKVMSRARPSNKQRLVQLLQKSGAVVAVTGDGTNDAPALNYAQVGLSMGSGTSVAKEASDITLLDDSFVSIGTAVMWGRSLYKNIQRFILFQLTINFVALLVVLLGSFFGTELPLTVTQMLWVNLIMDTFAAMALASIPPSNSVMNEKPRKSTDFIITRSMWTDIIVYGTGFLVALLALLYYFNHEPGGMTVHRLTIFFTVFVMLQLWNLLNAKTFSTNDSAFKGLGKSYGLEAVILIILVGQLVIVQFGGDVFRTEPLSVMEWVEVIALTSIVLWVGELTRLIRKLKGSKNA